MHVHNPWEATDSCHRASCFSSGLSAWGATSWGHIRSPLSPSVKPAWLHTESMGTSISAYGGNGQAAWSSCQEPGVKMCWSPPAWGPQGRAQCRPSQHIPPCWQNPPDLAFTLLLVRLGVMHHLPKDGVESLAISGKTLSEQRCTGQGVSAISNSWGNWWIPPDCNVGVVLLREG